jgi:hypothetical protein
LQPGAIGRKCDRRGSREEKPKPLRPFAVRSTCVAGTVARDRCPSRPPTLLSLVPVIQDKRRGEESWTCWRLRAPTAANAPHASAYSFTLWIVSVARAHAQVRTRRCGCGRRARCSWRPSRRVGCQKFGPRSEKPRISRAESSFRTPQAEMSAAAASAAPPISRSSFSVRSLCLQGARNLAHAASRACAPRPCRPPQQSQAAPLTEPRTAGSEGRRRGKVQPRRHQLPRPAHSQRTVRTNRSAIAFAFGPRTGVLMISRPSLAKTVSRSARELAIAVADEEAKRRRALCERPGELTRLQDDPGAARISRTPQACASLMRCSLAGRSRSPLSPSLPSVARPRAAAGST